MPTGVLGDDRHAKSAIRAGPLPEYTLAHAAAYRPLTRENRGPRDVAGPAPVVALPPIHR
jgi:hypothetical protein